MALLKILSVVGARPNFMKIAPFVRAIGRRPDGFSHILVHTGQHYDKAMSADFFEALNIPPPDVDLGIGSGTHAEQVGRTMMAFERVVRERRPDWVVVVGDVNATCACAITAKKERVRLAHIEAGLRSFDLDMPEEINRMVTDRLSDLLFTPDEWAGDNLRREGVPADRIKFVGNIMIDTLDGHVEQARAMDLSAIVSRHRVGGWPDGHPARLAAAVRPGPDAKWRYAALTLHRPSNVDDPRVLESLVHLFVDELSSDMPLLWSLHPRTKSRLEALGLWPTLASAPNIVLLDPLGYLEMLRLNLGAAVMLTDSGGIQEECCVLGTPCITLRNHTERPVTLRSSGGVSVLAGNDAGRIRQAWREMKNLPRATSRPALWDGHTAERIADVFGHLTEAR